MEGLCYNMSWRNWFNWCWLQMIWDRGGCCHYHKHTSLPCWVKVWCWHRHLYCHQVSTTSNTISIQPSSPVSAVHCGVGETKATGEDKLSWKPKTKRKENKTFTLLHENALLCTHQSASYTNWNTYNLSLSICSNDPGYAAVGNIQTPFQDKVLVNNENLTKVASDFWLPIALCTEGWQGFIASAQFLLR